jgi:hypothetical protein
MRFGNHFETSKEPAETTLKHRSEPPQQPDGYSGNKKQRLSDGHRKSNARNGKEITHTLQG